ncbi:heme peroxidase [Irpex rosettiformis]|uniref:Heme peroxidase n=1 Tax=Irpex rosettiformis TaxID=378272 RepID=A0ACB8UIM6_9APHY|nr:heme peroxidase [Irpex rosettiformis]
MSSSPSPSSSRILTFADFSHLSARRLPDAPDGRYAYQVQPEVTSPVDAASQALHSRLTLLVDNVKSLVKQGPLVKDPEQVFKAFLQAVENPDAIDDRQGFFLEALALLCKVPPTTSLATKANNKVIEVLYHSLPHPPAMYLAPFQSPAAPQAQNGGKFRAADGGGNNLWLPDLGRSGMPYARDVENKHPLPPNVLPDPGLLFDTLLRAKKDDWKPHPGGNSSLTFAFASLVTHSLFRTNPKNWNINDANSYLDLSPLYGINQDQQDLVRNKAEGRGYMWKDAFAEDRLILVPPAASALLVIFNRNHNYIADMILKINEQGKWQDPPPTDEKKRAIQDEEIFQTARLINCGHFMAMIFGDYVAGFLGLARDGSGWSMNPFDPIKTSGGDFLGRGEGNHVSVEFNLLYRWHAVTAQKDIKWTEDLFGGVFGTSKPFDELTMADFGPGVINAWKRYVDPNPKTRKFGGLERGPDGAFSDDDIARVLQDATSSPAAAYRAQGTPSVLRIVEIMSILQARSWGVCTMNEFRAYLGLKKFEKFEDWSSNPEVAAAARRLYGHIDNLELYPGLQAEDCMPLGPGSGICCGYTMTRAILGDAVALVRGDRFYTTDYTPANLTSWGFQDCSRDPNNGSFGSALPRLLLRHLPRHYPADNVYSLFPFFTPTVNKKNLTNLQLQNLYTYDRPKPIPSSKVVETAAGVEFVLGNSGQFKEISGASTFGQSVLGSTSENKPVMGADEFLNLSRDGKTRSLTLEVLLSTPVKEDSLRDFQRWTDELIEKKSYSFSSVSGTRVDIVQNVVNMVAVRWVSNYLTGLPLKTEASPRNPFTPQEIYDRLSILFADAYTVDKPEGGWKRHQKAESCLQELKVLIDEKAKDTPRFASLVSDIPARQNTKLTSTLQRRMSTIVSDLVWNDGYKTHYTKVLSALNRAVSPKDIAPALLRIAIDVALPFAKVVSQVVDFYLDDARKAERAEIVKLANKPSNDPEAKKLLLGYVLEAQRLRPSASFVLRKAAAPSAVPAAKDQPDVAVGTDDIVFVSLEKAGQDPAVFSDPTVINPQREPSKFYLQASGLDNELGKWILEEIAPQLLRSIFKKKNLRRAEGVAGRLAGASLDKQGTDIPFYLDSRGLVSSWPGSLTVVVSLKFNLLCRSSAD